MFASNNADFHPIFDFLLTLSYNGQSLMLNERIASVQEMGRALDAADKFLQRHDPEVYASLHASIIPLWSIVNHRSDRLYHVTLPFKLYYVLPPLLSLNALYKILVPFLADAYRRGGTQAPRYGI